MADHFLAAGDFAAVLHCLNAMQASQVDSLVRALLLPVSVAGWPNRLTTLAALPLAAQANLLLLLRTVPHRFSAAHRHALLAGMEEAAAGSCGIGSSSAAFVPAAGGSHLLMLLAAEAGCGAHCNLCMAAPPLPAPALVPPCPYFLYTPQPRFPWAPVQTDQATAADLLRQQAAKARRQQQQQQAPGAAADAEQGGQGGLPTPPGDKRRGPGTGQAAAEGGAPPAKRQHLADLDDVGQHPAAAATEEGSELASAAAVVRAALDGNGGASGGAAASAITAELRAALQQLLSHAAAVGGAAGSAALAAAGLDAIHDPTLLLVILSELVSPSSSFARCSVAAGGLLLPALSALDGPAPRDLAAAAEHIASCNPQAYISALLHPLLSRPALNKHQAELASSTIKASLPPQFLPDVVAAACSPLAAAAAAAGTAGMIAAGPGSGSGAPGGSPAEAAGSSWNEHTVAVLQAVLNVKPPLTAAGVAQLAAAFAGAVRPAAGPAGGAGAGAELAASVKFAKLALSLVKQYPLQAAAAKQLLREVAQATRSFMSKSLLAAVEKL